MNDIATQYAYFTDSRWLDVGQEPPKESVRVQRDQIITTFRGEDWTFKGVARKAYGNSSGRVAVSRTCPEAYTTSNGQQECVHMWHRNGIETAEYFPSVFELYLGNDKGEEI